MKALPFIPAFSELSPEDLEGIPGLERAVEHWTDGFPAPALWFETVRESWGAPGLAARRGSEVVGFALYGPPEHFARRRRYPLPSMDEGALLLADLEGEARIRKHLLVRTLRELKARGAGPVEAVATAVSLPHHVDAGFLKANGWEVVRRRGIYVLMRCELENTVEVGELARGLLDRVRLPSLSGSPSPAFRAGEHRSHAAR
ncbi:hypothetical protein E0L93_13395 [Rubrobacter taiwanensis]|jgi:hypothetical protein|uniref:N-acetyltransferase domain-containing protein n=1 Tax=Rubrobacter taiwanensis TaxID=185139 RepID=A0A4R1BDM1_9ACTN|nr:hypothetical protein [Rubrobacter taiwanensis]TCJ15144.1 hypothetical protein E0L93_13395 [Rubrobacter taiwanensis]